MDKKIICTDKAPKAVGPYSQAVAAGNMLFISGQIPVCPEMGEIPESIEAQTKQVMENFKAVLAEAGMDFSNVVKTTIYLDNMHDFMAVNQIYAGYFDGNFPARATVQVGKLPLCVRVEIEGIAMK